MTKTEIVWTKNTKPNRPGIWMCKGHTHPYAATEQNLTPGHYWSKGDWAFLMDMPDIKDPPRYRDVTAADVGREIEVEGQGDRFFIGFNKCGDVVYEYPKHISLYAARPSQCRILDTQPEAEQPKLEPREWWLNLYPQDIGAHATEAEANAMQNNRDFLERVHVREVVDDGQ